MCRLGSCSCSFSRGSLLVFRDPSFQKATDNPGKHLVFEKRAMVRKKNGRGP